jgi:hypothetical protein
VEIPEHDAGGQKPECDVWSGVVTEKRDYLRLEVPPEGSFPNESDDENIHHHEDQPRRGQASELLGGGWGGNPRLGRHSIGW